MRAQSESTAEQAATFARSGQHAEAARLYEKSAKRGFFSWDARYALLAAREYAAAGELANAERMLGKAEGRAKGDDAVLLATIEAQVALAKNEPQRAVAALRSLPAPLPAPLAPELLDLRAQAEFAAGHTLDGVRSYEERARIVSTAEARDETYRRLASALARYPVATAGAAYASDSEKGWLELGQLLAAAPGSSPMAVAQRSMDWRTRHPRHPGTPYLPAASAGAATAGATAAGAATAGAAASGTDVGVPATAPVSSVAVLLPLSGKQQAAALAVRDGIVAAWYALPAEGRPHIKVYDSAVDGALPTYQRAVAEGAAVVIGPLTREDVTLVAAQPLVVPTLVLNAYTGEAPPPFLFQFSLDPEQEARAVALRIAADGLVRGIALFPRSPWGQRIEAAFTAELQATGTTSLMASEYYEPGAKDFSDALRAALGRYGGAGDRGSDKSKPPPRRDAAAEAQSGPQFAFVAATPQAARALRPQLRFQMTYDLPIYATSDAWDPSVKSASDMDGLVFPEMPWILFAGQGAPDLWATVNTTWSRESQGRLRLYAFGYDAFRIASGLRGNVHSIGLQGLTGTLDIGADGRVVRNLQFARIEGGRPQPIGASAAPLPSPVPGAGAP